MTTPFTLAALLSTLLLVGCSSPPMTLTCSEATAEDLDVAEGGEYSSTDTLSQAAKSCFLDGYREGRSALACAVIATLDDGTGGFTLLFTDSNGNTFEVVPSDLPTGPDDLGIGLVC
jgi:hypothetical protein